MKNPNSLMNRSKSIHESKQSLDLDFSKLAPKKLNNGIKQNKGKGGFKLSQMMYRPTDTMTSELQKEEENTVDAKKVIEDSFREAAEEKAAELKLKNAVPVKAKAVPKAMPSKLDQICGKIERKLESAQGKFVPEVKL